jgi:hypothetical protein
MKRKIVLFLFILIIVSCKKENGNRFSTCNEMIFSSCDGSSAAEYCLFGIRWDNANSGQMRLPGSMVKTELTYSFMDSGYLFNTHSQDNLISMSFDKVQTIYGKI